MVDTAPNSVLCDLFETPGNVLEEDCNVNVGQFPNSCLPDAEHKLNWVAFGGVRGIVQDLAPVPLCKLPNIAAMNGRVVHHEDDVAVFEAAESNELSHVRREDVVCDGCIEDLAELVAALTH